MRDYKLLIIYAKNFDHISFYTNFMRHRVCPKFGKTTSEFDAGSGECCVEKRTFVRQ